MSGKLCFIISSVYPDTVEPIWNEEVAEDLITAKDILNDHKVVEIRIPVIAGSSSSKRLLDSALTEIDRSEATECHIVLNTHGTPGHNDIRHQLVADLVQYLSQKGIQITQISALMCDGMTYQSLEQACKLSRNRYATYVTKIRVREPSMVTLQKILNALTTDIPQNFTIRGVDYAYLPKDAHDDVVGIIRGERGETLSVTTQTEHVSPELYVAQIRDHVACIRNKTSISVKDYNKAADFLGKVLFKMKSIVFHHIRNNTVSALASECLPLYTALTAYLSSLTDRGSELNTKNFESVYKGWLKDKKLCSEERLTVLEEHGKLYLEAHASIDSTHQTHHL